MTCTVKADGRGRLDPGEARIIRPLSLVSHAREAVGALRMPAITHELVGSDQLWMGMTILEPGASTRPHHHGDRETGLYVVAGRVTLRWGPRLESNADLEVGDLAFVPPYVPHEMVNQSASEDAMWVVVWNQNLVEVPFPAGARVPIESSTQSQ